MKRLLTSIKFQLAVGSMLLFASCAQTIDPRYAMSADEMKVMKDAQVSHTADGAMKGAAIGAIGGSLAALAAGGDRDAILKGAAIGAVVGGTAGGVQGFNEGDQKGKGKVLDKRQRQTIEAGIQQKIVKLNSAIRVTNIQIKRLKEAQAAGESPASIQAQAKRLNDDLAKVIKANGQQPIERGLKGGSTLMTTQKKIAGLQKQVEAIAVNSKQQEA